MTARTIIVAVTIGAAILAVGTWTVQFLQQAVVSTAAVSPGDSVQAVLRQGKAVVAEFGSDKCAGCREMKKVLDALSSEHGTEVNAVAVDVLKNRDYIRRYKIQAIPTQVFYDAEGRETGRHMGVLSGDEILSNLGVNAATLKPAGGS
jgi:thioredoxin 1